MRPSVKNTAYDTAWHYLDLAQVIILVLRRDETVEFINQTGCDLLGHPKEFIIGKNWFEFFIPPKTQATDKYNYARALDIQALRESYENSIWTRAGEERNISWHASFIKDEKGNVEALLAAGEDITEQSKVKRNLREQQHHHHQLLSAVVDAQETEREEIAGELHGNVNQILTTCKLLLECEKARQPDSVVLGNVYEHIQTAISEIRNLSHRLDSTKLRDLGIVAGINELAEAIQLSGRYEIQFFVEEESALTRVKDRIALSIYRIVQEQLSNIIQHANATAIRISLQGSDNSIHLEISDNGKGFDVKNSRKGIGLRNIYSRVALHKGTVNIETGLDKGCTVSVFLPLH